MAETRETQVLEDVVESTEIENPRTTEEAILAQVIAAYKRWFVCGSRSFICNREQCLYSAEW